MLQHIASHRVGKRQPWPPLELFVIESTAQDMKTAFWLSEDPIGRDIICPRDGEAGCALVDWIPRHERREQTHFMSWTWKYRLLQVRDVLFHTTLPLFSSLNLRPNHGQFFCLSQCFTKNLASGDRLARVNGGRVYLDGYFNISKPEAKSISIYQPSACPGLFCLPYLSWWCLWGRSLRNAVLLLCCGGAPLVTASSVTFCGGVPAADCFPGVWQAEIDMKKATFTSTWLLFRSITG